MELAVTRINNEVNTLSADKVFEELSEVTQSLMQVNSKWESLRSGVAATELRFQMLEENYPMFMGKF